MNLFFLEGGQFEPVKGGQFEPVYPVQLKSVSGGQHNRFLHNSARDSIMKRMGELSYQKNELITTDPEFKKYMRFGLTLVNTVGSYFNEASLDRKRKVLGLIFSEKLIYEKPEYRTYKTNEILSLFDSIGKAFRGHEKEKASKNADFLCGVARTGIEPMTFGL